MILDYLDIVTTILTSRIWKKIPITQKTNTQTGVSTLHSSSDILLATGSGVGGSGGDWTISDLKTFTRLYNNANDPDISTKKFSNFFYNDAADIFNRDRGDVLNEDKNYPDIQTSRNNQKAFYDSKIPYVVDPNTGSLVNSKGRTTEGNPFSSEQSDTRQGSGKNQYSETEKSTVSTPNDALLRRTGDRYNTPLRSTAYAGLMRYPEKMPDDSDYISITAHDYLGATTTSFKGLTDAQRVGDALGTVILPIQSAKDSNAVAFQDGQLNAIQGAFAAAAGAGIEGFSDLDFAGGAQDMVSSLGDSAKELLNDKSAAEFLKFYFAGQAVKSPGLVTRATGMVLNQNLELLLNGPQLREFKFGFALSPRSQSEAQVVKNIISFFKKHMAVQRSSSTLFLQTPDIFTIKYMHNGSEHPYINKIKPCALQGFGVDYAPAQYMTYQDGSMTSYGLTMSFKELKPVYRDDQDNAIDGGGIGY